MTEISNVRQRMVLWFGCLLVFLSACGKESDKGINHGELYAETTADVTCEESENDVYVTIKYDAEESTAVNTEGKLIKGPIVQYTSIPLSKVKEMPNYKPESKLLKHHKIKVRYMKEEPTAFEMSEDVIKLQEEGNKKDGSRQD